MSPEQMSPEKMLQSKCGRVNVTFSGAFVRGAIVAGAYDMDSSIHTGEKKFDKFRQICN